MEGQAAQQIVAGEPRLRVLHQVFILSGCRNSRGHLNSTVMLLRLLVVIALLTLSCSRAQVRSPASQQPNAVASLTPKIEPTPSPTPNSPIRAVDFENFTYPEIGSSRTFTLKDGIEPNSKEARSVVDVIYGDVTADGIEDAMVVHSQSIRGSAIPYFVYVYAMNGTRPKLLWSFYAGERGDGGLRQISADGGEMVVELYGRDRVVNGGTSSDEDNMGVCCPRFFTRSRYEWRDGRFRLKTKEATLPNPRGNAAYLSLLDK